MRRVHAWHGTCDTRVDSDTSRCWLLGRDQIHMPFALRFQQSLAFGLTTSRRFVKPLLHLPGSCLIGPSSANNTLNSYVHCKRMTTAAQAAPFLASEGAPTLTGVKRTMPLRIGTHSGTFHCDEALGCWMLRQTAKFRDAEIVRTRDPEVLKDLDVVIDVGGGRFVRGHRLGVRRSCETPPPAITGGAGCG